MYYKKKIINNSLNSRNNEKLKIGKWTEKKYLKLPSADIFSPLTIYFWMHFIGFDYGLSWERKYMRNFTLSLLLVITAEAINVYILVIQCVT